MWEQSWQSLDKKADIGVVTSSFASAPRLDPLTQQETLPVVSLNAIEILGGFQKKVSIYQMAANSRILGRSDKVRTKTPWFCDGACLSVTSHGMWG